MESNMHPKDYGLVLNKWFTIVFYSGVGIASKC